MNSLLSAELLDIVHTYEKMHRFERINVLKLVLRPTLLHRSRGAAVCL